MDTTPSPPHSHPVGVPPSLTSPPFNNSENAYTVDLVALEAQVRALETQKAHLTAQITSLRSRTNNPSSFPTPPPTEASSPPTRASSARTSTTTSSTTDLNNQILASSLTQSTYLTEANYRLAGLTSFLIRDPSPPNEILLGVRIESFTNGRFTAPHYLILSTHAPAGAKSAGNIIRSFSLRHATIPPYFDLFGLARKYLPVGVPFEKQRLDLLVRELRRKLNGWNRRGEVLEELRAGSVSADSYEGAEETIKVLGEGDMDTGLKLGKAMSIRWDEARLNVEIEWKAEGDGEEVEEGRIVGNVRLLEDGSVDRSVVVKYNRDDDRGEDGERIRKLERKLKVEGLRRVLNSRGNRR